MAPRETARLLLCRTVVVFGHTVGNSITLEEKKIKIRNLFKLAAFGTVLIGGAAQAALQTWEFTGKVYQENNGFVPPAFATIGNTLTVDYLFDTTATIESSTLSVTFDGQTSSVNSSNLNHLNSVNFSAINVSPLFSRIDGVKFLSFNYNNSPSATTVSQFLNNYSTAASLAPPADSSLNLRLDFGPSQSVWASPTSFVMISSVPEPSAYAMLLAGLSLIGFITCRKSRNDMKNFA